METPLLLILLAGLITGFSKFSIGGMGLLIMPILMIAYPGPEALGIILPMYIITDIMAVTSYRQHICWPILLRILPLGLAGTVLGAWLLSSIESSQFAWLLGLIIIGMLILGLWLEHAKTSFMQHPFTGHIAGLIGGFVSMISNAAGPLFSLYFMEQKLSKVAYVSTRSWVFFFMNLSKVPLLWAVGVLNLETIAISLQGIPGLAVGAIIGYWLLNRIKITQLKWIIRGMATVAAIKLFTIG